MKLRELICYSRSIVRQGRLHILIICLMPLFTELFFRLAEASVCSLLLYFSDMSPAELFTGENEPQFVFSLTCMVLRVLTIPPLTCAAAFRLTELCCGDEGVTPLWEVLTDMRFLRRSVVSGLLCRIIGTLFFMPVLFSGETLAALLKKGGGENELFAAVQAAALTAVSLLLWAMVRLTLSAVPFLLVRRTDKSAVGTVFCSFRFMSGRRGHFLRLIGMYALPALSLIGLPLALPDLMTAFAVSISVFAQEDDYHKRTLPSELKGELI